MTNCTAKDTPNSTWSFCPSEGASDLFIFLFGATTILHIYQGIRTRKWYTAAPTSTGAYALWFILILVAPLWINGFVYMVLGRMVWNFLPSREVFGIPARRLGVYFVTLDIVAFLVQILGAVSAVGNKNDPKSSTNALHIYMVGCGIQQLFILVFCIIAVRVHLELRAQVSSIKKDAAMKMLYVTYAVVLLITIPIIFRLIEYAGGFDHAIPKEEAYMYCLDSLPMFTALVLLNVVHPGYIMPGKESDLPSRKERKMTICLLFASGVLVGFEAIYVYHAIG
ncbi:uncharacterized protein LY89DRAFT_712005 [Mollisia scopiformis]|uniref:RTA1-like protein n=1 Tax=Mollisia scopiformis TaxID=149040 RepID=A0A132B4Y8_MOLSC|nr:uncharacterized protein LY89DRAFT_712005 [Mollisia scopiformis]KUJ07476.1 hypothetical protein LY89DRAFT_712005 [Mollisia scopiformis]